MFQWTSLRSTNDVPPKNCKDSVLGQFSDFLKAVAAVLPDGKSNVREFLGLRPPSSQVPLILIGILEKDKSELRKYPYIFMSTFTGIINRMKKPCSLLETGLRVGMARDMMEKEAGIS
ncbi:hypothetical protein GTO89_04830 [Heliobacterium gestii]|uniref:Uncharacterized protein n=1 Tax=Heliomicrobium gestii TaxID=2699 RepID=A0A845LD11_HELGE|nr:hypothetical protein [Heliomicrobium gestii]MBM7866942.1 hypothetical protein [Heliomicrobium gestii]MZP42365.1 hypothetical protein [Heliomicrobium gestii]